jgi:hypothetical protein
MTLEAAPAANAAEPPVEPQESAANANVPAAAPESAPFRFPADLGGQKLAGLLPPKEPQPLPPDPPARRRDRSARPAFDREPAAPLAVSTANPPRLPLPPTAALRPRALSEGVPFTATAAAPPLPARPDLPAGLLVNTRGPDANRPTALPAGGQPVPDRVPLDDPTADFSTRLATSAPAPDRSGPAPFVRVNLPDPFEHAAAVRLREPKAERPDVHIQSPPSPGR